MKRRWAALLISAAAGVAVFAGSLALIHHLDARRAARRAVPAAPSMPARKIAAPVVASPALKRGDQPQGRTAAAPPRAAPPTAAPGARGAIAGFYNAQGQFWPLPAQADAQPAALVYDRQTADVVGFARRVGDRWYLLDLREAAAASARPGTALPAADRAGFVAAQALTGFEDAAPTPWLEALRSTYEHFNGSRTARGRALPRAASAPPAAVGAVVKRAGVAPDGRVVYVRPRARGAFDVVLKEADGSGAQAWLSLSGEQLVRLARAYQWSLDWALEQR